MKPMTKSDAPLIISLLVAVCLLSGCTEPYMSRSDKISFSAVDAVAANKAIHVNDPWPRGSFNTNARTAGQRVLAPIEHYRDPGQRAGPTQGGGIVANAAPTSSAGNSAATASK